MPIEPKKPKPTKFRKSFLAHHALPKGPARTKQIRLAAMIRGTRQWKAMENALNLLEKKGVLTEEDTRSGKAQLFQAWLESLYGYKELATWIDSAASNPENKIKDISLALEHGIDPFVIPKDAPVIGCLTADKKKHVQIFLEKGTANVRIVEKDI